MGRFILARWLARASRWKIDWESRTRSPGEYASTPVQVRVSHSRDSHWRSWQIADWRKENLQRLQIPLQIRIVPPACSSPSIIGREMPKSETHPGYIRLSFSRRPAGISAHLCGFIKSYFRRARKNSHVVFIAATGVRSVIKISAKGAALPLNSGANMFIGG